jgi:hypothetical protein
MVVFFVRTAHSLMLDCDDLIFCGKKRDCSNDVVRLSAEL